MRDDDFLAMIGIGVIVTLWLVGGMIAVGKPKTYRLGLLLLASGAIFGVMASLAWVS